MIPGNISRGQGRGGSPQASSTVGQGLSATLEREATCLSVILPKARS